MLLLDAIEELQSIEPTALQPDIEKNQRWATAAIADSASSLLAAVSVLWPFVVQDTCDQVANVCFVVDDENI